MTAADLVLAGEFWLTVGAGVALLFLTIGVDPIEPNSRGGYVFRVLILPGVCLLWPIVLWRWWVLESKRENWKGRHSPQRGPAGILGIGMAVGICLILITAAMIRPTDTEGPPPQKLSHYGPGVIQ